MYWKPKTEERVFRVSVSDSNEEGSEEESWQAGEDMSSGLSAGVRIPGVLARGFRSVPLARKLGQIWVKGAGVYVCFRRDK